MKKYHDFETEIHAIVTLALEAVELAKRNGEVENILSEKNDTIRTLQDRIAELEVILNTVK